jgi:hypothetical protein
LDDNTMYAGGVAYDFGVVNARLGWATANVHASTSFKANLLDVGVDAPVTSRLTLSLDYVNKDVKSSPDDTYFVRAGQLRAVQADEPECERDLHEEQGQRQLCLHHPGAGLCG